MSETIKNNRRILVAESRQAVASALLKRISDETQSPVDVAHNLQEMRALFDVGGSAYVMGIVDVALSGGDRGAAVREFSQKGLPVIATAASFDSILDEELRVCSLFDICLKKSPESIRDIALLVRRIFRNVDTKVLIVDDSASFRLYLSRLLLSHRMQVFEASDADAGMALMQEHPDIQLALLDYHMPGRNGVQLTADLRARYGRSTLAIIGITASGDERLGARFLSSGANDILRKPFFEEEFYARINNHLDTLDYLRRLEDAASRDFLTRLHNRRHLYSVGMQFLANARRGNLHVSLAMVDIDHFKLVNDTYGHQVGDMAIIAVANVLLGVFRDTDLVARVGGEEFCVLLSNATDPGVVAQRVCETVAAMQFRLATGELVPLTVSVGVTEMLKPTIDEMMTDADNALYQAKGEGRNCVRMFEPLL